MQGLLKKIPIPGVNVATHCLILGFRSLLFIYLFFNKVDSWFLYIVGGRREWGHIFYFICRRQALRGVLLIFFFNFNPLFYINKLNSLACECGYCYSLLCNCFHEYILIYSTLYNIHIFVLSLLIILITNTPLKLFVYLLN